jgi:hypothetical protein
MSFSQHTCLVSVKKDYSGSSTVPASVDVRSVGQSVGRRQIYAFNASLSSSIGESYGRKEVTARHVLPYSIGGRLIERREKKKRIKTRT